MLLRLNRSPPGNSPSVCNRSVIHSVEKLSDLAVAQVLDRNLLFPLLPSHGRQAVSVPSSPGTTAGAEKVSDD